MTPRVLLIAKEPVPGTVKTRLCPPCTPTQAARIAAAALADTIDVLSTVDNVHRTLVMSGHHAVVPGWSIARQRGVGLAERLVNAFGDPADGDPVDCGPANSGPTRSGPANSKPTRSGPANGRPTVLVGMDTPQLGAALVERAVTALDDADVALGPAEDGGWWLLGLRDPRWARALLAVPMSTARTGARTIEAFDRLGLRTTLLPVLRDVDTEVDARAVAELVPNGRFARAVAEHLPLACPVGADR